MSRVVWCGNKEKDKESAFIARGHSLQSSFFFNPKESLSETLTASIKTTYTPMSPRKERHPDFLEPRWWHSSDALTSSPVMPGTTMMMMTMSTTNTGTLVDVFPGWRTETGEGGTLRPVALPETRRGTGQSAMKCTNVTGKAPRLIGSPSMWPSCEERGQRRRQGMISCNWELESSSFYWH